MGERNPVVVPVSAENFDLWRPRLDWHFRSFCRCGRWTPDELWDDLEKGDRRLWVVWDGADTVLGAVLTLEMGNPVKRLILTNAAGRDRKAWLPLWPVIEAYARSQGCSFVQADCRSGWEPDLKRVGMRKTHITMEKAL